MFKVQIESHTGVWAGERYNEYVERKGIGHPDTLCDALAEAMSTALCQTYIRETGQAYHYNLDKSLLIAGQSKVIFGGGEIIHPMKLYIGDRATFDVNRLKIDVNDVVFSAARKWLRDNLRFVEPGLHIELLSRLRPGSLALRAIYEDPRARANDTSAGVGYAPLTETENIVLRAEALLNCALFKKTFPQCGEDIKVMGVRQGRDLYLTIAIAFVSRFVASERQYFEAKAAISQELQQYLLPTLLDIKSINLVINTLDQPGFGLKGVYLSVLGTSADGADSGEVGRGNRVNGLISFNRPMSLEAAAGKNATRHVGKIYNVLASIIAHKVWAEVPDVKEACVWLCSQIGEPIDQPKFSSIRLILVPGGDCVDAERRAQDIFHRELVNIDILIQKLVRGEFVLY